jgi:hypothetical protein
MISGASFAATRNGPRHAQEQAPAEKGNIMKHKPINMNLNDNFFISGPPLAFQIDKWLSLQIIGYAMNQWFG